MPATTAYSDAEFYEVFKKVPAPEVAQKKICELLEAQLNTRIAYANTQFAAAGIEPMKPLAPEVWPAPANLTDSFINHAVVALSVDLEVKPSGIMDTNSTLTVALIDRRIDSAAQVAPMWSRGLAVVAVLHRYMGGYYNADSEKLWNSLVPFQMTQLPESWKDYSGVAIHFTLSQWSGGVSTYRPAAVP